MCTCLLYVPLPWVILNFQMFCVIKSLIKSVYGFLNLVCHHTNFSNLAWLPYEKVLVQHHLAVQFCHQTWNLLRKWLVVPSGATMKCKNWRARRKLGMCADAIFALLLQQSLILPDLNHRCSKVAGYFQCRSDVVQSTSRGHVLSFSLCTNFF